MKKYKYTQTFTAGGRRYFVRANTQKELYEKMAIKKHDLEDGNVIVSATITVTEWAFKWLDIHKKNTVSSSTLADYNARLDKYILPRIGKMRVCDVKITNCREVLNEITHLSDDRIGKIKNCMTQMFETAYVDGLTLRNPCIGLKSPSGVRNKSRRAITPRERELTIKVAETHHAGAWILCMLYTGMRPQETAALQGRHIQGGMIVIEQALKKDGSISRPKSDAGIRRVPVPDELAEYFAKIKPFDFCFKSFDGIALNHRNMRTMWKSFKREMQIAAGCRVYRNKLVAPYPISDELVPYCYRHTFATDCAAADMPVIKLQKLMGHTSIQITSQYYIDMTDEMLEDVAKTMKLYRQK